MRVIYLSFQYIYIYLSRRLGNHLSYTQIRFHVVRQGAVVTVSGHFYFAETHFTEAISPKGHFTEETFHRRDISPKVHFPEGYFTDIHFAEIYFIEAISPKIKSKFNFATIKPQAQ